MHVDSSIYQYVRYHYPLEYIFIMMITLDLISAVALYISKRKEHNSISNISLSISILALTTGMIFLPIFIILFGQSKSYSVSIGVSLGIATLINVFITAAIAYASHQIQEGVSHSNQIEMLENVYQNIIIPAKGDIRRYSISGDDGYLSEYLTHMNRLGYYIYKGLLDRDVIAEQFAGLLVGHYCKNRKGIQSFLGKRYSKRFYWIPLVLSFKALVDGKNRWDDVFEYLRDCCNEDGVLRANLIPEDIERWISTNVIQLDDLNRLVEEICSRQRQ